MCWHWLSRTSLRSKRSPSINAGIRWVFEFWPRANWGERKKMGKRGGVMTAWLHVRNQIKKEHHTYMPNTSVYECAVDICTSLKWKTGSKEAQVTFLVLTTSGLYQTTVHYEHWAHYPFWPTNCSTVWHRNCFLVTLFWPHSTTTFATAVTLCTGGNTVLLLVIYRRDPSRNLRTPAVNLVASLACSGFITGCFFGYGRAIIEFSAYFETSPPTTLHAAPPVLLPTKCDGNSEQGDLVYRPPTHHITLLTDQTPTAFTDSMPTTYRLLTDHIPTAPKEICFYFRSTFQISSIPIVSKGRKANFSDWSTVITLRVPCHYPPFREITTHN